MFLKRLRLNDSGDTIVEVLIAVAVVGLILGGAYAITNLSFTNVRQAQEHSEALKIAEGQVEQLRQLSINNGMDADTPIPKNIFSSSDFCIQLVSDKLYVKTGADCTLTSGIPYATNITRSNSGSTHTFDVNVSWDALRGGKGNVDLVYNLDHQ